MQTHDQKNNDKKPGTANGNTPPPTPAAASSKPTDNRPPAGELGNTNAADKPKRERQKVHIVVGEVKEFKNKAEAEKFLNSAEAPKDFIVITGHKVEKKQKVSLR